MKVNASRTTLEYVTIIPFSFIHCTINTNHSPSCLVIGRLTQYYICWMHGTFDDLSSYTQSVPCPFLGEEPERYSVDLGFQCEGAVSGLVSDLLFPSLQKSQLVLIWQQAVQDKGTLHKARFGCSHLILATESTKSSYSTEKCAKGTAPLSACACINSHNWKALFHRPHLQGQY